MNKTLLGLLSVLALAGFASADADDYGYGMMGGMYHMMSGSYGYGGIAFGWITGLLFIAVLVLLIVWLIKQINKK